MARYGRYGHRVDLDTVPAELFMLIAPHLTENQHRLLTGACAKALGRGGGRRMARISGLSRPTVYRWARRSPAGSTTWAPTPAGWVLAPTTTPPHSRSPRCGAGGSRPAGCLPSGRVAAWCADPGGSNSYGVRLWKTELARFAADSGPAIRACHHGLPLPAWYLQVEQVGMSPCAAVGECSRRAAHQNHSLDGLRPTDVGGCVARPPARRERSAGHRAGGTTELTLKNRAFLTHARSAHA